MVSGYLATGLSVLQIIGINAVLSGDNAVLVALAIRRLPQSQRRPALVLGIGGAIGLQILATLVVAQLFAIPLLLCGGGLLLSWIALKLLREEEQEPSSLPTAKNLAQAIWTIIVANCLMSLDNVLAVASIGRGQPQLIALGLVVSIALILTASVFIAEFMDRYPFLVTVGAGILAWTAGRMVATDAVIDRAVWSAFGTDLQGGPWGVLLSVAMTAFVLVTSRWGRVNERGTRSDR